MSANFKFLSKWSEPHGLSVKYAVTAWGGAKEEGGSGQYERRTVTAKVTYNADGTARGFLNVSPSVSYYSQLKKAAGI